MAKVTSPWKEAPVVDSPRLDDLTGDVRKSRDSYVGAYPKLSESPETSSKGKPVKGDGGNEDKSPKKKKTRRGGVRVRRRLLNKSKRVEDDANTNQMEAAGESKAVPTGAKELKDRAKGEHIPDMADPKRSQINGKSNGNRNENGRNEDRAPKPKRNPRRNKSNESNSVMEASPSDAASVGGSTATDPANLSLPLDKLKKQPEVTPEAPKPLDKVHSSVEEKQTSSKEVEEATSTEPETSTKELDTPLAISDLSDPAGVEQGNERTVDKSDHEPVIVEPAVEPVKVVENEKAVAPAMVGDDDDAPVEASPAREPVAESPPQTPQLSWKLESYMFSGIESASQLTFENANSYRDYKKRAAKSEPTEKDSASTKRSAPKKPVEAKKIETVPPASTDAKAEARTSVPEAVVNAEETVVEAVPVASGTKSETVVVDEVPVAPVATAEEAVVEESPVAQVAQPAVETSSADPSSEECATKTPWNSSQVKSLSRTNSERKRYEHSFPSLKEADNIIEERKHHDHLPAEAVQTGDGEDDDVGTTLVMKRIMGEDQAASSTVAEGLHGPAAGSKSILTPTLVAVSAAVGIGLIWWLRRRR